MTEVQGIRDYSASAFRDKLGEWAGLGARADAEGDTCQPLLTVIVDLAEELCGEGRLGGRIWLRAMWDVRGDLEEYRGPLAAEGVLCQTEIGKFFGRRPGMHLSAIVMGPFQERSSVRYTSGKGFIGRSINTEQMYCTILHDRYWPPNILAMNRFQWWRWPGREGRSLEEARALRSLYGTAMGIPIAISGRSVRVGCLTLHSRAADPLSVEEIDGIGKALNARRAELDSRIGRLYVAEA